MGFFNFGVCGLVGTVCFLMILPSKSVSDALSPATTVFFDSGFSLGSSLSSSEDELLSDWSEAETSPMRLHNPVSTSLLYRRQVLEVRTVS